MIKLLFALALTAARAQENSGESWLQPIEIFGTSEEILHYPSEPQRLTRKKLEQLQSTDVGRTLKQISGAYVREEDGLGLRPNIGLRGTNPDRSKKIVILQDDVLAGPAPYSAPAAYHIPSMALTESLDIYKGFAALPFGPNSVGGALNYRTMSVFDQPYTQGKALTGSFGTHLLKVSTLQNIGAGSLLLQAARAQTDGFKEIDRGGSTGYGQNFAILKFGLRLFHPDGLTHEIQIEGSYQDERSHETYLGLTQEDFDSSFRRRYNASQLDLMTWKHRSIQLRHQYQLSPTSLLQTAVYHNEFERTWFRLDRFDDNTVNLRDILNSPANFANYYDILKGAQDSASLGANGQLVMAGNQRSYFSQGIQTKWSSSVSTGQVEHELQVGLRLHRDQIQRHHTADNFNMTSQSMVHTGGAQTLETDNREAATVWTGTIVDHLRWQDWTLTPAARFELVRFDFENRLNDTRRDRSDQVLLPGVSLLKKITSQSSLRGSVNRAATLAGLSSTGQEKREEAMIYELEWNYLGSEIESQFTLFYNDYRNLTGTCTASSGCSVSQLDEQFNGGKAVIYGAELKTGKNIKWRSYDFPVTWNLTYVKPTLESDFTSASPEWGVGQIRKGDPLPYVPSVQSHVSIGARTGRLFQEFSIFYQNKLYDQSARTGRKTIDGYGLVDWSANYAYSKKGKILAKIDNILAREYAVAARPFGLRPGKPQSFHVGVVHEF